VAALPLAPLERMLFSLGTAIVGTPLPISLAKIGLPEGQHVTDFEDEQDDDLIQ